MVDVLFNRRLRLGSLFLVSLFGFARVSHAQWLTQSIEIKHGWNAVFLHVDPFDLNLDTWAKTDQHNPITEIWRWNPRTAEAQSVDDPPMPARDGNWDGWIRGSENSELKRLVGDTAYLVKAGKPGDDEVYMWEVQGKPVAPHPTWNRPGLNLVGFPTVPNAAPNFDKLLAEVPGLQSPELEIYRYEGLALGEDKPIRLQPSAYRETPARRGQAFWIRAGAVSSHSGPFEVDLTGSDGVKFADDLGVYRLRLRNLTSDKLTISMELLRSEAAPDGQTDEIGEVPPLLVRGPLNLDTRNYDAVELSVGSENQTKWELAARGDDGSEVTIVLGLDRSAITEDAGSLLAGILRFKDSLDISEVNVPVSSRVDSSSRNTGLWVGEARVTHVSQYLKSYERHAAQQSDVAAASGADVATPALVIGSDRAYKVTDTNTDLAPTPRWFPFPLRLIIHRPAKGKPTLLQQVFYGKGSDDEWVVARSQAALDPNRLAEARRISATHLPWTAANAGWQFDGNLTPKALVKVTTDFKDQASNPFLHTFHPDHDNLDPRFEKGLDQGVESYTVVREISLKVRPPGNDFNNRVSRGRTLTGDYSETIHIGTSADGNKKNDTRQFEVRGTFRLHRISDIAVLTAPPR